ncbi:replicative DNA helicase [Geomonas sp. Red421]|uniref:Replicative DNA helicase n=2 Tax=Geomonas anaerohicana TaxID=2798583 RepID=A0ABS0YHI0_9BACT|nr:replicative DNA helicase [Geomonas anaerohicana]
MITERGLPPQNIEAEMSILGGILVENAAIATVDEFLTQEAFYREGHRQIFKAMAGLCNRNEPVDLVTLSTELARMGALEEVGGASYLATLVDFVPMAANIAFYCRIVAEKAQERRLIAKAQEAVRIIYDGGTLEKAVEKLEHAIQPAIEKRSTAPVGMGEAVRDAIRRIEKRYEAKGDVQGLPYGLPALDKATSGMHSGELIIIAGRPSMGKTALGVNILANACTSGKSALLFTLEMSRVDIVERLAAGHGIKYQNIRSGQLGDAEWSKLAKVMGNIYGWKLSIDDTPAIGLREMRAKAYRQKREGLDLIVIDYLQLMALSDPKISRVQGLGEISRGLKQLARELDISIVALAQLSRAVDARNDKRPIMSDLRDSGEIEQDADVILFPYRPAAYCEQCKNRTDDARHTYRVHQAKAEIIIEKQRAGERNISVAACWLGEYQRFEAI